MAKVTKTKKHKAYQARPGYYKNQFAITERNLARKNKTNKKKRQPQ